MTLAVAPAAHADVLVERSAGAEACPDTASFADRMRDERVALTTATSTITVHFEHTTSGYRAWVGMADGAHRSLADDDAPSCDALAEATVLAVKMALDLDVAPPAPRVAQDPPPPTDVAVTPPTLVARRDTSFAEVSATGILTFGIGSPIASGVRGTGALVIGQGRWSLGITGLALPAVTRDIGGGAVDISVLGGGMEGCVRSGLGGSLLMALCGRIEGMRVGGSAHGFARTEEHGLPLLAGTVLGRARAKIAGPVALFVEAGAVVPFYRERFAIDTIGVVYDPPIVAAATGIGVLVDFE